MVIIKYKDIYCLPSGEIIKVKRYNIYNLTKDDLIRYIKDYNNNLSGWFCLDINIDKIKKIDKFVRNTI